MVKRHRLLFSFDVMDVIMILLIESSEAPLERCNFHFSCQFLFFRTFLGHYWIYELELRRPVFFWKFVDWSLPICIVVQWVCFVSARKNDGFLFVQQGRLLRTSSAYCCVV